MKAWVQKLGSESDPVTSSIDDEALLCSAKALHFDLIEKPARASVVALKLDQALAGQRTE